MKNGSAPDRKAILYIEDNLSNMEVIKKLLEASDYEFLWSSTGLDGIHLARHHHPDLILVDINLTDITGIDVVRKLRNNGDDYLRDVPIIAITGDTLFTEVRASAMEAGCDFFVEKPIEARKLLELVANLTAERQPEN